MTPMEAASKEKERKDAELSSGLVETELTARRSIG